MYFDDDVEKQPKTGRALASCVGNCHMALWQLINWADNKLHQAAAMKQHLAQLLEQAETGESVQ